MSAGSCDPRKISFEQSNAMVQLLIDVMKLMTVSHKSLLEQASEMEMPKEVHSLISRYSDAFNAAQDLLFSGVEEILEHDIGAPPKGGIQ